MQTKYLTPGALLEKATHKTSQDEKHCFCSNCESGHPALYVLYLVVSAVMKGLSPLRCNANIEMILIFS